MPILPIFENAEITLVPCRSCPRQHLVEVDQDTRRVLAYHGYAVPIRSGEPLTSAFDRILNAPCEGCQSVQELDHDFVIASLPAKAGG